MERKQTFHDENNLKRASLAVSLAACLLAACAGNQLAGDSPPEDELVPTEMPPDEEAPEEQPQPGMPTPEYDYLATSALTGSPQDSHEGTFELYLRDAISQRGRLQRERIDLRVAYQDPAILEQDMPGLVTDVALVEDRSEVGTATDSTVVYDIDIDIVVTFADNQTDILSCNWSVSLEEENGLWYVIQPVELAPFSNCAT